MEIMEIILLIAGGLIFILSFFIPDGKENGERKSLSEDEVNQLLAQELGAVRGRIENLVQEIIGDAMEETERSLEKLSNEKIMAVSEYSDTVLKDIHSNHEEAMFLYDMLNNKHTSLKNALAEINHAVEEAEKAMEALKNLTAGEDGTGPGGTEAAAVQGRLLSQTDRIGLPEYYRKEAENETGQNTGEEIPEETEDGILRSEEQERNNKARILNLYRQGKTVVDIARELELGVGEVKLVVDLFQ